MSNQIKSNKNKKSLQIKAEHAHTGRWAPQLMQKACVSLSLERWPQLTQKRACDAGAGCTGAYVAHNRHTHNVTRLVTRVIVVHCNVTAAWLTRVPQPAQNA